MNILFIGGTRFFGRRLVESAIDRGHDATVFHRGRHTLPGDFNVSEIHGDRNGDLSELDGHSWDVVVDCCGYLPQSVAISTTKLKAQAKRYVFVSSVSVYDDHSKPEFDESTSVARLTAAEESELRGLDPGLGAGIYTRSNWYGASKAMCEDVVTQAFGTDSLIIRPGLIVGSYDHTDRFTYWVMRIAAGGEVLVPGVPENPVQFIDARDLAEWSIKAIESRLSGEYNVTGFPGQLTFGEMLETIKETVNSNAEFIWVDEDFLKKNEVAAWTDLPLFLYSSDEIANLRLAGVGKAKSDGLETRSLVDTVADLFAWRKKLETDIAAGISREREEELLRKWKDRGE